MFEKEREKKNRKSLKTVVCLPCFAEGAKKDESLRKEMNKRGARCDYYGKDGICWNP